MELLIVFFVGRIRLHERHNAREYVASVLVLIGVTMVTIFG